MNKVILIGNLTRDPELTETPSGVPVCRFAIAVSRDYADSQGNRETDFFNITTWRGKAETCGKYLKKGNKVAVCGSLQNRSYEDKDGIKRTVTDVIASDVEFLTPKQSEEESILSVKRERPQLEEIDDNQLPF
ncbi:MAG: single-stranded DNA-binding protein [Clostridia bacterium]|nr:single-stranded DNA-binding protein [Clostridia bacterium]